MGISDDPLNPHSIENLRRSIAMLGPQQTATIERRRALVLLGELQRLQAEHATVIAQLTGLLERLEARGRHPSGGSAAGSPA